jgi:DNA ligase (NAD+)
VALRCPNRFGCPAQLKAAILFFGHRGAMNIDHLGAETVEQLVDRELVHDISELFVLQFDDLMTLEGYKEKKANNLLQGIRAARETATLERLLTGIGIPLVGGVAARSIAGQYPSLSAMLNHMPEVLRNTLEGIDGVGPKIAASVAAFFGDERRRQVLQRLVELGLDPAPGAPSAEGERVLAGKTFVLTGTLSRPRPEIKREIEAAGGKVTGSVSGSTDYLVAGEKVGQSKRKAAEKHGVTLLTEAELRHLMEG